MTVEMAYSPPFSSAIDSINAAAYVADNLCAGLLRKVNLDKFFLWIDDFSTQSDWLALDIRHPQEATPYAENMTQPPRQSKNISFLFIAANTYSSMLPAA